jgi:hypothetical protein
MRTAILMAAMTAIFVAVGALIGGQTGILLALLVAAGTNFYAYWNSDKMALASNGAQEVDETTAPELVYMVAELAQRANMPMPRVYVIHEDQPNAFATGRNPENAAVAVNTGLIAILTREELAGVTYKGKPPTMNYELELEAQRRTGLDFFCGLTFPVNQRHLTLVVGGWGGSTVGISSIDREDASQNETTLTRHFKDNQWYKIRLKVEPSRIQAWIDAEQIANVDTTGKDLDLRPGEIDLSTPLGIATFRTTAAFRNIRLRKLQP